MNSREFRDELENFILTDNGEWIFFGNKHKAKNELTLDDMNYLATMVNQCQPTSLGLANVNINDDQLACLMRKLHTNTSIHRLYFPFNAIGNKGAAAIADMLAKNKTVDTLILFSNKIGDFGMSALANILYANRTLTKLELFDNQFSETSVNLFRQVITHNEHIQTLALYPGHKGILLAPAPQKPWLEQVRQSPFFQPMIKKAEKRNKLEKLRSMELNDTSANRGSIFRF